MNTEIIQKIFNLVVIGIDSGWLSIQLDYKADDQQSEYSGTYETDEGQKFFRARKLSVEEKSDLNGLLEKLRKESAEMGGEPFTHCTITFSADGDFKIKQGFEPIDWSIFTE